MKLIRLTSGEEIVCTLIENETTVTIENGMMLIPAGEGKIGFMPFMAYSNGDPVTVDKKFVMFVTEPATNLADQVREQVTGIKVPPQQSIIV